MNCLLPNTDIENTRHLILNMILTLDMTLKPDTEYIILTTGTILHLTLDIWALTYNIY